MWIRAVVEAYRLDRYDNERNALPFATIMVVEAYRLDRYDNLPLRLEGRETVGCRSLSFG